MLVEMTDSEAQKTSTDMDEVTTNWSTVRPDVSTQKSRLTKKHVIIAVTCAVVACAVIAGIVVGVKLFLDSTHDIVKKTFEFKDKEEGKIVEEDIESDMTDNWIQYHVKDAEKQTWVVNDFNRNIQIIKMQEALGYVCYVAPLNTSDTGHPEEIGNAMLPTGDIGTVDKKYEASESTIKEKTMLGPKGEKLCDGLNTYWMTENCEASADSTSQTKEREKRRRRQAGSRAGRVCYYCKMHDFSEPGEEQEPHNWHWACCCYTIYKPLQYLTWADD